jgi:hypothetical protein
MKINIKYIFSFLILLIIEVIIALYVRDAIIRPYIGDILVVILMYTFIRGIIRKPIKLLPVYLFIFASAVELAQYFHIVDILHLKGNRVLSVILGASFDIKDILCYLAAAVLLIIWEKAEKSKEGPNRIQSNQLS